ncbi:hypothetical protein F5Y08DRAFT_342206 [Xylaria arbuscula]|nr:hypothetical protein F5Y08DRAFT_342206 [Xylaria arbuscula]
MPVIVECYPEPVSGGNWFSNGLSSKEFLDILCFRGHTEVETMVQSSYHEDNQRTICHSDNGFICTVFAAYTSRFHLVLRPEDIWIAILTQFGYHTNAEVNENAPHLHSSTRHNNAGHILLQNFDSLDTVEYDDLTPNMANLIGTTFKDPSALTFIMPNWSETTKNDRIIAYICTVGAVHIRPGCLRVPDDGRITTVTLLGNRADWVDLKGRVETLGEYGPGDEPRIFSFMLQPIMRGFIDTFDYPTRQSTRNFWSTAILVNNRRDKPNLYGWMNTFLFWNQSGECRVPKILLNEVYRFVMDWSWTIAERKKYVNNRANSNDPDLIRKLDIAIDQIDRTLKESRVRYINFLITTWWSGNCDSPAGILPGDGSNHIEIPAGFLSVPVWLENPVTGYMAATELSGGSVGTQALPSGLSKSQNLDEQALNTVKPVIEWWIYRVKRSRSGKPRSAPDANEVVIDDDSNDNEGSSQLSAATAIHG